MADVRLIDANSVCKKIVESIRCAEEWANEAKEQQDTHGLRCATEAKMSLLAMLDRIHDEPTIEVEPDKDWISVKDRLPEPGIPVLALQFDIPHSRRIRYRLVRLVVYDTIDPLTGKKMMSWFPNYGGFCVENIAYWQPLPKIP